MFFLGVATTAEETRAVIYDLETTSVLVENSVAHEVISSAHGPEQDPADWINALNEAVVACLESAPEIRKRLVALSISADVLGPVLLGAEAQPIQLCPLPGNTSAVDAAKTLSQQFGGPPGTTVLGTGPILPDEFPAHLLSLKGKSPELISEATSILTPGAFIRFWLTGELALDSSEASHTGLLNRRYNTWSGPLLKAIDPDLEPLLPPIQSSGQAINSIRPEIAEAWGVPADILVVHSTSLPLATHFAAGAHTPDHLLVDLGSSLKLSLLVNDQVIDPAAEFSLRTALTDRFLLSGQIRNGLSVLRAVGRHYELSPQELENLAHESAPGAEGISFVPHFSQEKLPLNEDVGAALTGLTLENFTRSNVCRAAFEAIAKSINTAVTRINDLGPKPTRITVTGIGSGSDLLCQLIAEATRLPVTRNNSDDNPALGAAMTAAYTLVSLTGEPLSYEDLVKLTVRAGRTFEASSEEKALDVSKQRAAPRIQIDPQGLAQKLRDRSAQSS